MSIDVEEIIGRAEQGVTRPFLCRCDDEQIYYVKGELAGRRSQLCEFVAGELARMLELPVAPFGVVLVPKPLIQSGARKDLGELGWGPAFGSLRVSATELTTSRAGEVPSDMAARVYFFDWWIKNADRTLTEWGGNPNLLWDISSQSLVVIDHNQAFDRDFDPASFAVDHALLMPGLPHIRDWVFRDEMRARFSALLAEVPSIWEAAPLEWHYVDEEQTVATDLSLDEVMAVLERCNDSEFWEGI